MVGLVQLAALVTDSNSALQVSFSQLFVFPLAATDATDTEPSRRCNLVIARRIIFHVTTRLLAGHTAYCASESETTHTQAGELEIVVLRACARSTLLTSQYSDTV